LDDAKNEGVKYYEELGLSEEIATQQTETDINWIKDK
jgi:hypothetical protein